MASVGQVGGFRPPTTPRSSWIGAVLLGAAGEDWPRNAVGTPLLPLTQVLVDELVAAPPAPLAETALVTLFADLPDLPNDTPNGDGWTLRTYDTLDDLEPLVEPGRSPALEEWAPRPFPVQWHPRVEFPSQDDRPLDQDDEEDEEEGDLDGLKVGGWPRTIQHETTWAVRDTEFVLQVDSVDKAQVIIGDAGTIYVGWSPTAGWQLGWQCC